MGNTIDKYFSLIVVVAIIAVILSRNSSTAQVLQTASSSLASILGSIVAPVTSAAVLSQDPTASENTPVFSSQSTGTVQQSATGAGSYGSIISDTLGAVQQIPSSGLFKSIFGD